MSDLERVKAAVNAVGDDKTLDELNAHLKEDAERERHLHDEVIRQANLILTLQAQRDDLLAALRKIEREAQDPAVDLHTMTMVVGIARAAIAEAETIR